ncbi:hypothetical protein SAMN05444161_2057 [Rhizobiales bacterium GAS191]|jgi:hypothetical protein|nr:hypothetical protein SAMN05519103_01170 [Rhizobiales bacterium GAS113]SEC37867.1 hypothetical protein SAMN05519104_1265 [Rhizobiales bacterium GAS188]SEC89635.1 hypothetical protein SAMN05444161_2057 [Rhizobiales bacterium GAS191]
MLTRYLAASAITVVGLLGSGLSAQAQDAREAEILGFHQLCEHGDRRACVRFGVLIQQNADRQVAWRHAHPDWFWWER